MVKLLLVIAMKGHVLKLKYNSCLENKENKN